MKKKNQENWKIEKNSAKKIWKSWGEEVSDKNDPHTYQVKSNCVTQYITISRYHTDDEGADSLFVRL